MSRRRLIDDDERCRDLRLGAFRIDDVAALASLYGTELVPWCLQVGPGQLLQESVHPERVPACVPGETGGLAGRELMALTGLEGMPATTAT